MIKLLTFGPAFGLPDGSPFVMKAATLLKLAGLPFETRRSDVRKSPRHKLPVLVDGDTVVPDSTLIRFYLEDKYGIDFDAGLTPAQKGTAWAIEKLLEDHLYWVEVKNRWLVDSNFDRGPRQYFNAAPALIRPFVMAMIRRQVRNSLWAQGIGRYSDEEVLRMTVRGVDSIAAVLADKPFLMGDKPCGADATVFAFTAGLLCPVFQSRVREHAETLANLVAYRDRGLKLWYPEYVSRTGSPTA